MKKILTIAFFSLLSLFTLHGLDFEPVDKLFRQADSYPLCLTQLQQMLPQANGKEERAEVLWRLSRAALMIGEESQTKESKREYYQKGIGYAEQGIREDPDNHNSYMWHSANVGKDCLTRSLAEMVKSVPVMMNDVTIILDGLGRTECSEAWEAIAQIYSNHPFKSDNNAISFARKAAMYIPSSELRLSTYQFLAEILYERNWSSSKRSSAYSLPAQTSSSNIETCCYLENSLGASYVPQWSSRSLSEMSDREEAKSIVAYAMNVYKTASYRSKMDNQDYDNLLDLLKKWSD